MERSSQRTTDALFAVQLACATGFCGRQLFHMLETGPVGVSIVMFASIEAFNALNLTLAIHAHRARPSRLTRQAIVIYAAWVVLWGANLGLLLYHLAVSRRVTWEPFESWSALALLAGLALVAGVARERGLGVRDPIARAWVALTVKGLPQVFQGAKFLLHGGAGFAPAAIAFGHVTVLLRLGHLGASVREASWDRNRVGAAISEIGNELSWIVATACWLAWRFGG